MLDQTEEPQVAGRQAALPDVVQMQVAALEAENEQLREALASRIAIEQAKGVLAERYRLDLTRAFELLRRSARSERRRIHQLAAEVAGSRRSPAMIEALAAEFASVDEPEGASRG